MRVLILAGLLLAACEVQSGVTLPPTATTLRVVQVSQVPTADRVMQALAFTQMPADTTTTSVTETACLPSGGLPMVSHDVVIDLDYSAHRANTRQETVYVNRTSEPLSQIIYTIEANRIPQAFELEEVTSTSGGITGYELTGRRLKLDLVEPLQPGCALEISLDYRLQLPPIGEGVSAYQGYFGYSARQMNFGNALPVIAPRVGGEWINHPAALVGEQYAAESSRWHVELNVLNVPEAFQLALPGTVEHIDGDSWDVTLESGRDFSFSLSSSFQVMSQNSANGVLVEIYYFDDAQVQGQNGPINGAAHALEAATRAVEMYSDLFGQYPYERLAIVQGDFPDGMEHTGLVFVGGDWFRTYNGTPQSYLFLITLHEVAHQWWYNRVGSDQALAPYLDESLATYSELIFLEEYYPELRDWWWSFRVNTFVPQDYSGAPVDSTVYQFDSARAYINAVYLRGANMLEALRRELGTDAFFAWLRRYADSGRGRVVSGSDLWSLLTPDQLALTADIRNQYLQQDYP